MKSLNNKTVGELIIKNSRFICLLIPIESDDIFDILESIRMEYPKATHYCYAYIFHDSYHSSDDGEPGGTAGIPILNVLQKENIINVLCVVVRYFGGIKLGAGGLVRAYTKSVTDTIKISSFHEMEMGYKVKLQFSYEEEKNLLYLLKNCEILEKEYLDSITYICYVNQSTLDKLNRYNPFIIDTCYIKKLN